MWCLERNIHIAAVHLPGELNTIADTESQKMLDRTDWKLNPVIFQEINNLHGLLDIDLFVPRLSTHCPFGFQHSEHVDRSSLFKYTKIVEANQHGSHASSSSVSHMAHLRN